MKISNEDEAQAASTKPNRLRSWLSTVALLMIVGFSGYFLWLFTVTRSPYGVTASNEPAQFIIGDRYFSIPKSYIWLRSQWSGGKGGVNLQALLPEFSPYTQDTKGEFVINGNGKIVSFLLEEHSTKYNPANLSRRDVFENVMRSSKQLNNLIGEPKNGPYGFKVQLLKRDNSGAKSEYYFRYLPDGSVVALLCIPAGSAPSPSCSGYIDYAKNISIHYHYSRELMKDWQSIEDGLRKIIQKFETNSSNS